jgi:thymidylate kinase
LLVQPEAVKLLKRKKLNVYVFRDVKEYFYGLNLYGKLFVILKTGAIHGLDFFAFFTVLTSHGIFSMDSVKRYIKLCVFNTALREFIKHRKVDVVLLDQWIIQGIWSATIFRLESHDKIQNKLSRFYFKTDFVLYFDIDAVTASERIDSRDSNTSRFDKMNVEKRLIEFEKYNGYLFQLYSNSACENKVMFSTKETPEKNAEDFFSKIEYLVTDR